MIYHKIKIKVRSGGKALQFFIVEDLTDHRKVYTLERSACDWFDAIKIGSILEVIAKSDGTIYAVISKTTEPENLREEEWYFGKEKRWKR